MSMATEAEKFPLAMARGAAENLVEWLAPACERIEIAGSVRRGRSPVGDLDLVAVSKPGPADMFGNPIAKAADLLSERMDELLKLHVFDRGRVWGPKQKEVVLQAPDGLRAQVWSVRADQWGVALMIRTGSQDFSHAMVTPAGLEKTRGYMPAGWCVRGNCLWKPWDGAARENQVIEQWEVYVYGVGQQKQRFELVPTPEEADVFAAYGMAWVEPHSRG